MLPIYLDEAILHRIAFTVWHTALHLEREQVRDDVMVGTFAVGLSQHLLAVKSPTAEKTLVLTLAYITLYKCKRTNTHKEKVFKIERRKTQVYV
jgi:hypothetical protein